MSNSLKQRIAEQTDASAGPDGCWPWRGSFTRKGYGQISYKNKDYRAHRLAWESANGPIPTGLHVLHRCDVRSCVNPGHLFLGTNIENVADKLSKGREQRGERSISTLTESDVTAIRRDPRTLRVIADDLGVHWTTIGNIKTGATWGHVKD